MAMAWNVGLDLGGESVRMALRKGGVVFSQSALAAYRPGKKKYVALGDEAMALRGREPVGVQTGVMLEGGRIAKEALLDMWLPFLFDEAHAQSAGRPVLLLVGAPNAREADLQAVRQAAQRAGAPDVGVLEAEFAAALGAWYPKDAGAELGAQTDILENVGTMVVDVGAYSAFAALIAGGHIVRQASLPFGLHAAVVDVRGLLRSEYGLAAGENTVEEAFRDIAALEPGRARPPREVCGLYLKTGMPGVAQLRADSVLLAVKPYADAIARMAASVLLYAPAELAADILARGILLTGGGARVPSVRTAIEKACGARARVSDVPEMACIRGAMRVMSSPNRFGELPLTVGV